MPAKLGLKLIGKRLRKVRGRIVKGRCGRKEHLPATTAPLRLRTFISSLLVNKVKEECQKNRRLCRDLALSLTVEHCCFGSDCEGDN